MRAGLTTRCLTFRDTFVCTPTSLLMAFADTGRPADISIQARRSNAPQHVAEKKPVSEVCNEAEIQPSLFYTWQRELLAGAHTVFSTRRAPSRENELEAKISRLEARVARKGSNHRRGDGRVRDAPKKTWGSLNGAWIPHDRRDEVVDFVNTISTKTRLPVQQVVEWCGLARGKFYDWRKRYGKVNEHNGLVPRDHWIEDWEPPACDRLLRLPSAGRVSATDVHDAGRRRGGLEPIDDVPCVVEGGPPGPLEREAVEEGNGLRSAAATAPTLAYGYLVLESGRDVLLPVLRFWMVRVGRWFTGRFESR